MTRTMRTNHRIGSRIKRKWGKVGAPHSKKRKAWLRKISRKKKRRSRKKRRKKRSGLFGF